MRSINDGPPNNPNLKPTGGPSDCQAISEVRNNPQQLEDVKRVGTPGGSSQSLLSVQDMFSKSTAPPDIKLGETLGLSFHIKPAILARLLSDAKKQTQGSTKNKSESKAEFTKKSKSKESLRPRSHHFPAWVSRRIPRAPWPSFATCWRLRAYRAWSMLITSSIAMTLYTYKL